MDLPGVEMAETTPEAAPMTEHRDSRWCRDKDVSRVRLSTGPTGYPMQRGQVIASEV